MNKLIALDQQLLLAINGAHAPWADTFFWWLSSPWTWLPVYFLLIGLLFWQFGWRKAIWMTLALIIAVGLSDYISSGIIKHLVCRPRPTHEPALAGLVHIVNGYTGGKYGFVSSHAANTMCVATLFSLLWQQKNNHGWWLLIYVALNCYSRMYLGAHYPGDIIGGLIVGALMALAAYEVLRLAGVVEARRRGEDDVVTPVRTSNEDDGAGHRQDD